MAAASIGRRGLVSLALAAAAAPARADAIDLALTCDTTLAPALNKLAGAYRAMTSVRVFVFPTGPGLILPQLRRDTQSDIVVAQVPALAQAAGEGLASATHGPRWRNSLVIAGLRADAPLDGRFAAADRTPASDIDGPAVAARLGLRPARLLGAVDTDEVAFMLIAGAADAGLLHMTDVRADPRLAAIRMVPPDVEAPRIYGACVTKLSQRPNPDGFLAFMASDRASALLRDSGLEMQT
jgi:ABC-type molybdate transport system substrate-binding protein